MIHSILFDNRAVRILGLVLWIMAYVLAILFLWCSTLPAENLFVTQEAMLIRGLGFALLSVPLTFWMVHAWLVPPRLEEENENPYNK